MKKAILTKEQAKAFEESQKVHSIDEMLHIHTHETFRWEGKFEPLNDLHTLDLVSSIYVGYEIKKFKIGDWVFRNEDGKVSRIIDIDYTLNERGVVYTDAYNGWLSKSEIVHATDEEKAKEKKRRWWAKHNRKVKEVKKGDIIVNDKGYAFVVSTTKKDIVKFKNNGWLYKDQIEKGNYEIACFVEDRKDG